MRHIISEDKFRTDTPGAFFSKDKAQPLDTIFFSGGAHTNTAIVIAGVRSVSPVYIDERATALHPEQREVYSFLVSTDNGKQPIACSYYNQDQAHNDRYTLLRMVDLYWLK